ncbi:hypothetical protein ASE38_01425 [Cellulomonas sp. Root930]|nr:hypothetical protein ASE38_01425 [Cellulomonas sp. Root930]
MTAYDALGAARRRWYVVVGGLVAIAILCFGAQNSAGVYWTQVDVVFLIPQSARNPNSLEVTSQSLISTAGVVALRVNHGETASALSSSSVSLVGEGIRDGHSVRLPNAGGQWADNYTRPVLDVQVVGPSRDDVRAELDALLAQIQSTLDDLQISGGADEFNRITTQYAPSSPVISFIATQAKRAIVAIVLLGSLLTLAAVVLVDGVVGRRARRRAALAQPDDLIAHDRDLATLSGGA